ncbi:MAG: cytochrome c-type biogenesis protein CcmH [Deltaproteobacteria bacterium]|nr:cytochrome c-type biogenesis protein CcmH [Deltaproteobacteria bacterium]
MTLRRWHGARARYGRLRVRALQVVLLAALVGAGSVAPARAEPDAPPGWGEGLASELMSPYCPGRALPDCPSPQAAELRQWIVVQEREGRTRDDVLRQLLARFGDEMLQKPRARGFGLTAYGMPIASVVSGGVLLVVFLRRETVRRSGAAASSPYAPADAELGRLVDEEFRRAKEEA